ncbi:UNVERIFIED_CONTAM: hypothetical protein Sindi_2025600 [Sesamum indicum]
MSSRPLLFLLTSEEEGELLDKLLVQADTPLVLRAARVLGTLDAHFSHSTVLHGRPINLLRGVQMMLLQRCRGRIGRAQHAASSSERAENPEDGHSQLAELEGKVIQEMAGVFGGDGTADMRRDMEQMSIQIGLLQRAVGSTPIVAHDPGPRVRIRGPKAYSGDRDAKEVENILFDMEQYFLAADVRDEARKAIREQFFPENVEYNARRALRKLEHTGSMREYVKAFSALMLSIRDMSEADKLFTFMEGLKQ